MSAVSSQEIRQLVRDALRELLPANKIKPEMGGGTLLARLRLALADPKPSQIAVRMDNHADLNAFARELLQVPEDIKLGILSGKIHFGLAQRPAGAASAPATRRSQHQISKGVVTEIMAAEIGKTNDRLVIGKGVVVTPLARDKAREVKLEIVRDRP
jgi:hypothetical protein